MYKRIILMILVIGFLSCNPASAVNLVTNGDFETGDLTGWSTEYGDYGSGNHIFNVSSVYAYDSGNGVRLYAYGWYYSYSAIYQYVDFTDVSNLSFDKNLVSLSGADGYCYVSIGETTIWSSTSTGGGYSNIIVDVSAYSGSQKLSFVSYSYHWPESCNVYCDVYYDNIIADDETAGLTEYITWSTWPEDSWAVGNYSMITVGLPRPPDPVDFYIKTPSTDYIKKPLTKSPLVRTWNYEESQWYYQYFHIVYHSQYGDYSCKIVNSSANFIEYSNITVPYSSPDVPIPPVVTIPTPDPIETPPEWNVTIPEQYENVSWIFDYTDFWDELGITLNDTLYSTVGLIFIPMESINESVYTVYTHVDTAADMVSGSEHTNVIVQVAWNVIPDSIKTIFIGAAAIGLCIFILHRRT